MGDTSGSSSAAAVSATNTGSQPDPLIGRVINDRFRIIAPIARGGMGKVYKAEQAPLGRICAVKVLNPNYAGDSDPEFHKRFFLEASIASKLSHPNTVTIFDYGRTDDDIYYMAMEYLEGRTLHRLIRDEAPLDAQRVLHIARQVCRSLREAHGLGVIHRDLKPANIYLIKHDEENDFVKVLDFGLVKNIEDTSENLTQTGLFMGSPKYMAPEQIRGEKVTPRTDIYALGVVMYEMLTSKVPFDRANSVNTLMAHVSEPVPPMREMNPTAMVPPAIEDVVYKCLQKRSEDRYASMDELLTALKRAAAVAFGGAYQSAPTGEFSTATASSVSGEIAVRTAEIKIGGAGSSHDSSGQGPIPITAAMPEEAPPREAGVSGPMISPLAPPSLADPSSTPFPVAVPAERQKKSRTMLTVGIVAWLAIGGGVIAVFHKRSAPAGAGSSTASTPLNAPAPVVHVNLDSNPPNAEVFENGISIGHTPLQREWTGERGDPSRSHTFTFRLDGYQDATVTLSGANLTYRAELERSQTEATPSNTQNTVGSSSTATNAPNTAATRPVSSAGPRPGAQRPGAQRPGAQRPGAQRPGAQRPSTPPPGYRSIDDWK